MNKHYEQYRDPPVFYTEEEATFVDDDYHPEIHVFSFISPFTPVKENH